jgi:hypothetical protein
VDEFIHSNSTPSCDDSMIHSVWGKNIHLEWVDLFYSFQLLWWFDDCWLTDSPMENVIEHPDSRHKMYRRFPVQFRWELFFFIHFILFFFFPHPLQPSLSPEARDLEWMNLFILTLLLLAFVMTDWLILPWKCKTYIRTSKVFSINFQVN